MQSTPTPDESTMTEESLDMEIEPEQLAVDERAVSEEINTTDLVVEEPTTATPVASSSPINKGTTNREYTTKQQFDIFLHNLANCVNKELIDSAAIEFLLNLNTKNNRKKLTNTLFGVQR